jgi:hypothetical protein
MPNGNLFQLGVKFNIQNSSMDDEHSNQGTNSFQFSNGRHIDQINALSPSLSYRTDPFERQKNPETAVIIEELRQLRTDFRELRESFDALPELIAQAIADILKPK